MVGAELVVACPIHSAGGGKMGCRQRMGGEGVGWSDIDRFFVGLPRGWSPLMVSPEGGSIDLGLRSPSSRPSTERGTVSCNHCSSSLLGCRGEVTAR